MPCHCDSAHPRPQWIDLAAPEYNTETAETPDQDTTEVASASSRTGNPYFNLPHPIVYKLRTCCLDDFIPHIPYTMDAESFFDSANTDNSPYYTTRKLELPDTGVAYLFRGIRINFIF